MHDLEVNRVTIGKGFNDIRCILEKYFVIDEFASKLSDYCEYSDANEQYCIYKRKGV